MKITIDNQLKTLTVHYATVDELAKLLADEQYKDYTVVSDFQYYPYYHTYPSYPYNPITYTGSDTFVINKK